MSFVDAETMVREFLSARIEASISTKIPNPRPPQFVRAWRTGGAAMNRVLERAQITIQAWDDSDDVAASDLIAECRTHILNGYTGMPLVRGVEEISGPYWDPDPTSGVPRYSFTVSLMVRATHS